MSLANFRAKQLIWVTLLFHAAFALRPLSEIRRIQDSLGSVQRPHQFLRDCRSHAITPLLELGRHLAINNLCELFSNSTAVDGPGQFPSGRAVEASALPSLSIKSSWWFDRIDDWNNRAKVALGSASPNMQHGCQEVAQHLAAWNSTKGWTVGTQEVGVAWCGQRVSWFWSRAQLALVRKQHKKATRLLRSLLRCPESSLARGPLLCLLASSAGAQADAAIQQQQPAIEGQPPIDGTGSANGKDGGMEPVPDVVLHWPFYLGLGAAELRFVHRVAQQGAGLFDGVGEAPGPFAGGLQLGLQLGLEKVNSEVTGAGELVLEASQGRGAGAVRQTRARRVQRVGRAVAYLVAGGECGSIVPHVACMKLGTGDASEHAARASSEAWCGGGAGSGQQETWQADGRPNSGEWGHVLQLERETQLRTRCLDRLAEVAAGMQRKSEAIMLAWAGRSLDAGEGSGGGVGDGEDGWGAAAGGPGGGVAGRGLGAGSQQADNSHEISPSDNQGQQRAAISPRVRAVGLPIALRVARLAFRGLTQASGRQARDPDWESARDACRDMMGDGRLGQGLACARAGDGAAAVRGTVRVLCAVLLPGEVHVQAQCPSSSSSNMKLGEQDVDSSGIQLLDTAREWAARADASLALAWRQPQSNLSISSNASLLHSEVVSRSVLCDVTRSVRAAGMLRQEQASSPSFDMCRLLAVAAANRCPGRIATAMKGFGCFMVHTGSNPHFLPLAFMEGGGAHEQATSRWAHRLHSNLAVYAGEADMPYADGILGYWPHLCINQEQNLDSIEPGLHVAWDRSSSMPCLRLGRADGMGSKAHGGFHAWQGGIPGFLVFSALQRLEFMAVQRGMPPSSLPNSAFRGQRSDAHGSGLPVLLPPRADPGCVWLAAAFACSDPHRLAEPVQALSSGACGARAADESDDSSLISLMQSDRLSLWLAAVSQAHSRLVSRQANERSIGHGSRALQEAAALHAAIRVDDGVLPAAASGLLRDLIVGLYLRGSPMRIRGTWEFASASIDCPDTSYALQQVALAEVVLFEYTGARYEMVQGVLDRLVLRVALGVELFARNEDEDLSVVHSCIANLVRTVVRHATVGSEYDSRSTLELSQDDRCQQLQRIDSMGAELRVVSTVEPRPRGCHRWCSVCMAQVWGLSAYLGQCFTRSTGDGSAAVVRYIRNRISRNSRAMQSVPNTCAEGQAQDCDRLHQSMVHRHRGLLARRSSQVQRDAASALAKLGSSSLGKAHPRDIWRASLVSISLSDLLGHSGQALGGLKVLRLSTAPLQQHVNSLVRAGSSRGLLQAPFGWTDLSKACFGALLERKHLMAALLTAKARQSKGAGLKEAAKEAMVYARRHLPSRERSVEAMVLVADLASAGTGIGARMGALVGIQEAEQAEASPTAGAGSAAPLITSSASGQQMPIMNASGLQAALYSYSRAISLLQQPMGGLPDGTPPDAVCACDACCLHARLGTGALSILQHHEVLEEHMQVVEGQTRALRRASRAWGTSSLLARVGLAAASEARPVVGAADCNLQDQGVLQESLPYSLGVHAALRLGWLSLSLAEGDQEVVAQAGQWFQRAGRFAAAGDSALGEKMAELGEAVARHAGGVGPRSRSRAGVQRSLDALVLAMEQDRVAESQAGSLCSSKALLRGRAPLWDMWLLREIGAELIRGGMPRIGTAAMVASSRFERGR